MRYTFKEITECNMCHSKTEDHKILGRRMNKSQGRKPSKSVGISTTVQKCSSCGLIYSNPQPIPYDIQDHYGVPPENYWIDEYFEVKENAFDHDLARLKELRGDLDDIKFLDIGAGLGKQMVYYGRKGFDVYGIEPSVPFYERAISKMGIDAARLKNETIEDAEYKEGEFDFISFGVVLEHVYDPSHSLEKAMKWLKPGGLVHIEVPSADWLINKIINKYYRLRLTDYVGNISPMHSPYHLFEFGLDSFQKNGKVNNYEVVHHDKYVCKTFMPKILDGPLKFYMRKTGQGMQLAVWLRKQD